MDEIVKASLLLGVLVVLIFLVRLLWRERAKRPDGETSPSQHIPTHNKYIADQNGKVTNFSIELPDVGESGTATDKQLAALERLGVGQFDGDQISFEQASMILSANSYIGKIYRYDIAPTLGRSSELDPPEPARNAALALILSNSKLRNHVVEWNESVYYDRHDPERNPETRSEQYNIVKNLLLSLLKG